MPTFAERSWIVGSNRAIYAAFSKYTGRDVPGHGTPLWAVLTDEEAEVLHGGQQADLHPLPSFSDHLASFDAGRFTEVMIALETDAQAVDQDQLP